MGMHVHIPSYAHMHAPAHPCADASSLAFLNAFGQAPAYSAVSRRLAASVEKGASAGQPPPTGTCLCRRGPACQLWPPHMPAPSPRVHEDSGMGHLTLHSVHTYRPCATGWRTCMHLPHASNVALACHPRLHGSVVGHHAMDASMDAIACSTGGKRHPPDPLRGSQGAVGGGIHRRQRGSPCATMAQEGPHCHPHAYTPPYTMLIFYSCDI